MEQRETWTSSGMYGAPMADSSEIEGAEGAEGKEERGKRSDADLEVASEEVKSSKPLPAVDQQQQQQVSGQEEQVSGQEEQVSGQEEQVSGQEEVSGQEQQVSGQEEQGYGAGPKTDIEERVGDVAGAAEGTAADPYDVVPTDWELLTLSQMGLSQLGPSAGSSGGTPESLSMLDGSMLDASTLSSVLGDGSFMVPPGEERGGGERGGGGEGIFPLPSPSDVVLMERASEALGGLHASEIIPPSYGVSPRGIVSNTHEEGGDLPGGGGQAAGSPPFITTWQRAGYGMQSAPGPLSASPPSTATTRSSPPRLITPDVKSSVGGGDHQEGKEGEEGGDEGGEEGTSLGDSSVGRNSSGGRDGGGGEGGGGKQSGDGDTSLGGSLGEDAWRVAISSSGLGGGLQTSLSGSVGSRLGASKVVVGGEASAVGEGGASSSEYAGRRSSLVSSDASALTNADDSELTSTETSGVIEIEMEVAMAREKDERGGMVHEADRGVLGTAPDEGVSSAAEGEKEEVEERETMITERETAITERRYYDTPYVEQADEDKKQQQGEPVGYGEGEGGEEGRGSSIQSCIGSRMPSHAVDDADVPAADSGQGGQENQEGGETEEQQEGSTAASAGEGEGVQQQGGVAEDGKMMRNGNESILNGRWWRWSWYELWHNRQLLLRQCQATLRGQSGTLWSIGVVAAILGLLLVGNQWYWERWQIQQARNPISKKEEMIDDLRSQMLRWKDGFVSRYRVPLIRTASGSVYSGSFH